ncbi:hypothetical protein PHYBOEH_011417 [Phytophthora boehmeriae]|uniref:Rho-GAP domain-containing protein n=1 Tax=Phytophthora boehmeriae TaxID=109152 RepID=A0A8T1WZC7_9STRA|nr:hypothetical protein PHYBOEH_011417 [Phytophthora boehmeriae]
MLLSLGSSLLSMCDRSTRYPKSQDLNLPSRPPDKQEDEADISITCGDSPGSVSALTHYEITPSVDVGAISSSGANEDSNEANNVPPSAPPSPVAILETDSDIDAETTPFLVTSHGIWVSCPYKVREEMHVTYNSEFARYEGLPDAWRNLNHQFGVPVEEVPKREVLGYDNKLPAVLEMMKTRFLAHNGARTEGVFRLAPEKHLYASVKRSINDGCFDDCSDVHVLASLIKAWFRELPVRLFDTLPICELEDPHPKAALQALETLPALQRSITFWLLDLLNEVVGNERENKMTAKSMGEPPRY